MNSRHRKNRVGERKKERDEVRRKIQTGRYRERDRDREREREERETGSESVNG